MLSILSSALVTIFSFFRLKRFPSKWWSILFFIFFNWLLLEIIVYLYLLYIVHSGNSLFLIGNQKFLDMLIKKDIREHIFTQTNAHNSFYQIDPDLGYTVGKNKSYWLYHSSSQGLRADKEYSPSPHPRPFALRYLAIPLFFAMGNPTKLPGLISSNKLFPD